MKKQQIKAFTLVELIIVITILAILATIGFMSYQSYTLDARDGKRKRDLSSIRSGLEMYQAKKASLPMPDNYATLSSGTIIGYQGYAGTSVLSLIRAGDSFQDSSDKAYYTYGIDINKTKYQLLAMLEINPNTTSYNENILNQTYALDYTNRYSYTLGKGIGIYLSGTTKLPVQEGNSGSTVTVNTSNISVVTSNASNVTGGSGGGTGGGGGATTYAISGCPTINASQNGTFPTKTQILANITDYIGCDVIGGEIAGYTYSGIIAPENKMILVTSMTDELTAQWGLFGTDLSTLVNNDGGINDTNILSWDGLNNTQKILVGLTLASEIGRATQLCNAKGNGWYLPATEELNQLYCYSNQASIGDTSYGGGFDNADCIAKGYPSTHISSLSSFSTYYYWSNHEFNDFASRGQNFSDGFRGTASKNSDYNVRCVSRF